MKRTLFAAAIASLPVSALAQYYNAAPQFPIYQPNNPSANLQSLQRSLQPPPVTAPAPLFQQPMWPAQQQLPLNCYSMQLGNMWTTNCR